MGERETRHRIKGEDTLKGNELREEKRKETGLEAKWIKSVQRVN